MRGIYKEYEDFDLVIAVDSKLYKRIEMENSIKENGDFNTDLSTHYIHQTSRELKINLNRIFVRYIPRELKLIEGSEKLKVSTC